jgi:hypothetical protein
MIIKSLTVNPLCTITMRGDGDNLWTIEVPSGIVSLHKVILINSHAVGGATFQALTDSGNFDGGGNTGWIFSGDPLAVAIYEDLIFTDLSSSEFPLKPTVNEELRLVDAPSYTLAMVRSIINEFLSLSDYKSLVLASGDYHIFDDEVVDNLSVTENQPNYIAAALSISESLGLADDQDLVWFIELIETLFIYDELRHGWKVTAGSSLILVDSIQKILGMMVDEWINFIDIQSNNWNGREIISEDVTLYDIAKLAKICADSLSDSINIADVSTYQLTITVLEYLGFTELANAMRTSAAAINDSIGITDNPALEFPLSVESILSVVDLSTVAVQFLNSVQSALGLADVSSLIKRISDKVTDPIVFVDTITSHAHLYSLIYDTLALNVIIELDGEVWECYVLNTPKFHPSMYSGFNFNSFCVFENRAFGANDTGIYELTGETDAGSPIHTGVILSKTNFGSPNQKRFRRGYLDISGTSPKMILETGDGQRQAYTIDEQGKMVASHELKSKKWILSVADFETLDSMKLIPVILTK